ncbi:hypothetical protein Anapl_13675 [Anas platyrhynchos]|uniref:Uncharacterized protein n=1 Tax=Anas platyrhynchos TaxID=8839 RepID=R0LEN0_ANAPL|nr:hypothetical protein Anapl_13675 [Anas platyrhynchos]
MSGVGTGIPHHLLTPEKLKPACTALCLPTEQSPEQQLCEAVQVYTVTLVMKSGNFSFPCAAVSVPHAFSITRHVRRAERTGRDGGGLQDKDPCSHSGQENTQDFILIFP